MTRRERRATFGLAARSPSFARLYTAQTISLAGDALTWVGLALLADRIAGGGASTLLAIALSLRVASYVLVAPLAGVLADRFDRRTLLIGANLARMALVAPLAFASERWQVYLLLFGMNVFAAIFTPTYQACLPAVVSNEDYDRALSLSGATYELLGVLGPGVAGGIAIVAGGRSLFLIDALTFLASAALIWTVRTPLREAAPSSGSGWQEVLVGSRLLWRARGVRFALLAELVAAIVGAAILVDTIEHIRHGLHLGSGSYGLVMAAFGVGATLAAITYRRLVARFTPSLLAAAGAIVTVAAIAPGDNAGLALTAGLWAIAGTGQNWTGLAAQTAIAREIPKDRHGRVFGAHFAWSHLWWLVAYPIAGLAGLGSSPFATCAIIASLAAVAILVLARPRRLSAD